MDSFKDRIERERSEELAKLKAKELETRNAAILEEKNRSDDEERLRRIRDEIMLPLMHEFAAAYSATADNTLWQNDPRSGFVRSSFRVTRPNRGLDYRLGLSLQKQGVELWLGAVIEKAQEMGTYPVWEHAASSASAVFEDWIADASWQEAMKEVLLEANKKLTHLMRAQ